MRIALVSDAYTPDINGVVSSVVTLENALKKLGHEVFIITNHKGRKIVMEDNVLHLPGIELKRLYGFKMSTPFHNQAIEMIKRMNLDIIHVHTEFGVGIFGRLAARALHLPAVITYHTMYEDYTHYVNFLDIKQIDIWGKSIVASFSKFISNTAQGVIAPSEKTLVALKRYGVRVPIHVIPTGLDFEMFERDNRDKNKIDKIKKHYHINDDDHVVIYLGRIAAEKSIEIPIEAFRYIKNKKIKFMIVGGGPQLQELQELAASYQLQDQIIFTNRVERSEIGDYYACGECFVSASLSETQGLTYIEAMAANLPVFARYDDVLKNLVIDGESGYYFEDAKDFAKKLEAYFELELEERKQFERKAREKVDIYDARVFASKVIKVYQQAIDDYNMKYEVVKIQANDSYIKISFMNNQHKTKEIVCVSLDDYLDKKLSLHKMVDQDLIIELKQKEISLKAYYGAIKKLCGKAYSIKAMKQSLNKIEGLAKSDIDKIINRLVKEGYLNDMRYVEDRLASMNYAMKGKSAIISDLKAKGIDEATIDKAMMSYDDSLDEEKAISVAKKMLKSMKSLSIKGQKDKLMNKLMHSGFDLETAKASVEALLTDSDENKLGLAKNIEKAKKHYQNKYQGRDLKQKVISYCMQKGFKYDDIIEVLDEMEWVDE